jgi:hypothetical protein
MGWVRVQPELSIAFQLLQRLEKPHYSSARPKTITAEDMTFVQSVISGTVTPGWVHSVPANFGEKGAGSLKADEWRLLATIYLPVALVVLWGERSGQHAEHFSQLLRHSMAIFQATTIVCQYSVTTARRNDYRRLLKLWVDELHSCHPHTRDHTLKPNVHVAFHIFDFLRLFGPALSWWCFPFEQLIGLLQRMNTNDQLGGTYIPSTSQL